jgi:hypothetical protein
MRPSLLTHRRDGPNMKQHSSFILLFLFPATNGGGHLRPLPEGSKNSSQSRDRRGFVEPLIEVYSLENEPIFYLY